MKALYIFCIILLISVVFGHNGHHRPGEHDERHKQDRNHCSFVNSQHDRFDLYLLKQHYSAAELSYYDSKTGSTIHFDPCATPYACPINSSVCISTNGKTTSYGSIYSSQSTFLSSSTSPTTTSLEVITGQGELCNTGVPRKTIITYSCAHLDAISQSFDNYKTMSPISSVDIQPCYATINVESPFACPVDAFCSSIRSSKDCDDQPVCGWMFGKCQIEPEVFRVELGMLLFVLIAVGALCLCCICGLCMYMFIKKSQKEKNMTPEKLAKRMEKKNKKLNKKREEKSRKVSQKKRGDDLVEMDSFKMPYELIPGGVIAVEEYPYAETV